MAGGAGQGSTLMPLTALAGYSKGSVVPLT
jgi:hypothetical protein